MANDIENEAEIDGLNLDEIDQIDPTNITPEQADQLLKVARPALHQRAKYKNLALDSATGKPFKEMLAEAKAKPTPSPTNIPPAAATDDVKGLRERVDGLQLIEEKRQIGYRHELSPEETDLAFQLGSNDPAKVAELLKKENTSPAAELFRSGIEALRAKTRQSSATPSPSSRAPVVDGKTAGSMNHDERRKNWGKITQPRG